MNGAIFGKQENKSRSTREKMQSDFCNERKRKKEKRDNKVPC